MSIQMTTPTSAFLEGLRYPLGGDAGIGIESRVGGVAASIGIISENRFFRGCLARCLTAMTQEFGISSHDTWTDWLASEAEHPGAILLLCATGEKATEAAIQRDLSEILAVRPTARIMLVSDAERPSLIMAALKAGARGFVSMNTDLDIALGAIRLVHVGGTFIPASGLMSVRDVKDEAAPSPKTGGFSQRQLEVLELARQGDPNKIIAYKLNMSEATAKIHIRNMMRKLNARNRTELIFKSNELLEIA